jgi:catalase
MTENGERPRFLTNRQGHPIPDNQHQRTVGDRGPATLENYHFIEKISHFDRERVPERVVHARGFTAHGVFEAYGTIGDEPASTYTRAKLFQEKGKQTPVVVRLSTVIGGKESSETARDPRGFAVKFKTEDGNWDLVGINLPVFFIRDAIKFPDLIHALKPDPISAREMPNRVFDFLSLTPESMHMITWVFSPRGIPKNFRTMDGFGVNTYKLVDAAGKAVLVKYHWRSQQGVESLTQAQANEIQATNLGHASEDIFEAIERGDYPRWELSVQIMEDGEHPELDFDPLDDTKVWPEEDFPLRPVGMMTLNRNVSDHHNENEQVAFGTGVLVDGLDFSDDRMLQGRTFSYSDTQRYRVGPNYLQLPINAPLTKAATNQRGGQMSFGVDGPAENPLVNYEPSSLGGLAESPRGGVPHEPEVSGRLTRATIPRTNDYGQAGERYRTMPDWEREDLVLNLVEKIGRCERQIQERMVEHFVRCDTELGSRVAEGIGLPVPAAEPASHAESTPAPAL